MLANLLARRQLLQFAQTKTVELQLYKPNMEKYFGRDFTQVFHAGFRSKRRSNSSLASTPSARKELRRCSRYSLKSSSQAHNKVDQYLGRDRCRGYDQVFE